MKTTTLCVILILSLVCHRGHSASLTVHNEVLGDEDHLQNEETSIQDILFRAKRHSVLSLCRYCCSCCKYKGCGYCCST